MLIGDPAPPERARDFCTRWPGLLRDRLTWFVDDASLASAGWSAYGAALAEGLMGVVAEIYAARLGRPLLWVLDEDPKSA